MIGQTDLLDKLHKLIKTEEFPQFSIFIGAKGSGKNTLMQEIAPLISSNVVTLPDVKIDTIREMIESANKKAAAGAKIVYVIRDSEMMSIAAKNSILKIVEEPPKGAYFMMSVVNEADLLDTIKNRAAIFRMRPYSSDEMKAYLDSIGTRQDAEEETLILQTANTLHDIDKLVKLKPRALEDYVEKFIYDLLHDSTPAKLLNTIKGIAFKDESDGYDLELVWRMFCRIVADKITKSDDRDMELMYAQLISNTIEKIGELRYSTVSKEKTYDMWVLDCRKIVRKWKSEN